MELVPQRARRTRSTSIRCSIQTDIVVAQAALEFAAKLHVADFGPEATGEELEAMMNIQGFQEFLFETRIFAEAESGEVDESFRIVYRLKKLGEFGGDRSAEALLGHDEFCQIGAQAGVFVRVSARFA